MRKYTKIGHALLIIMGFCFLKQSFAQTTEFCKQIHDFSSGIQIGAGRTVSLTINGSKKANGVVFSKACKVSPMDDSGRSICLYLSEHTSNENLAPVISKLFDCVTGIEGVRKTIWVDEMSGKFTVSNPFNDIKNNEIVLKYFFKNAPNTDSYFELTSRGVSDSE